MHSDPQLVERVARLIEGRGLKPRVMFGGAAFFLGGTMCVGIWHDDLIVRVGVDASAHALPDEHAKVMDLTGRAMRGWLQVAPAGCETAAQLGDWIDLAIDFVGTLPAKPAKPTKTAAKAAKKKPASKTSPKKKTTKKKTTRRKSPRKKASP